MQEAGALVELLQAPVSTLVEEIDGTRLVHADVSVRVEILIVLHSHYPEVLPMEKIIGDLSRRNQGTVRKRLRELHAQKLVHGAAATGYKLTTAGYDAAVSEIEGLST